MTKRNSHNKKRRHRLIVEVTSDVPIPEKEAVYILEESIGSGVEAGTEHEPISIWFKVKRLGRVIQAACAKAERQGVLGSSVAAVVLEDLRR